MESLLSEKLKKYSSAFNQEDLQTENQLTQHSLKQHTGNPILQMDELRHGELSVLLGEVGGQAKGNENYFC